MLGTVEDGVIKTGQHTMRTELVILFSIHFIISCNEGMRSVCDPCGVVHDLVS